MSKSANQYSILQFTTVYYSRIYSILRHLVSSYFDSPVHVFPIVRSKTVYIEISDFVQTGEIPANSTVGRMLMNLVDSVPQIKSQEFEAMMNNNMQVGD